MPEPKWIKTNSPNKVMRTDDIWFFDEQTGWLINSNGDVRMTTDGGQSWDHRKENLSSAHGRWLRCMGWGSLDRGWIGAVTRGASGFETALLHRTKDGGKTWQKVTLPTGSPAGICGLYVVSDQVVYGSGSNDPDLPGPSIVKTTDGGTTWKVIPMSDHADNLIDLYFENETTGWAVGGKKDPNCPATKPGFLGHQQYAQLKPVILKTMDGGQTWVNKAANIPGSTCGEWGWKIQFLPDLQVGFVSLEDLTGAAFLRTDDGGESWRRQEVRDAGGSLINNNLEGVGFLDSTRGWVGGWGKSFTGKLNSLTNDGGQTWVAQNHEDGDATSDPRVNVNRYRFVGNPPKVVYCSGKKVYRLDLENSPPAALLTAQAEKNKKKIESGLSARASTVGDELAIQLIVPEGARKLQVSIWNHFAVHQFDLIEEDNPTPGARSFIWDGSRSEREPVANGTTHICRVTVDDESESFVVTLP